MAMDGIDISGWQKGLDLSKLKLDFVIIKATEGAGHVQSTCDAWVQQARRLGLCWGFYEYLTAEDPVKQADWFYSNCRNYFGEGVPCVDYEGDALKKGTAWLWRHIQRVHDRSGVWPMLYTSRSVLKEQDFSEIRKRCALWVAQYATDGVTKGFQAKPWFPDGQIGGWKAVTVHQYSGNGRLPGYSGALDLDKAYITPERWKLLANPKGDEKPAEKPTEKPADKGDGKLTADEAAAKIAAHVAEVLKG